MWLLLAQAKPEEATLQNILLGKTMDHDPRSGKPPILNRKPVRTGGIRHQTSLALELLRNIDLQTLAANLSFSLQEPPWTVAALWVTAFYCVLVYQLCMLQVLSLLRFKLRSFSLARRHRNDLYVSPVQKRIAFSFLSPFAGCSHLDHCSKSLCAQRLWTVLFWSQSPREYWKAERLPGCQVPKYFVSLREKKNKKKPSSRNYLSPVGKWLG